jgi:hypothetical protein
VINQISLLTSFPKVLEKVMSIQLLEHLNNNNILVEEQFGFRTNEIQKALNSKKIIGLIFVTLKRLMILLIMRFCCGKLNYGAKGKAKLWLKSYLSNRYSRVLITNADCNPNELQTHLDSHIILQNF